MLLYFTRRSVVGLNAGTDSGITRADLNLLKTSVDLAAVIPDVGQDCLATSRGEAYVDAARKKDRMTAFIVEDTDCIVESSQVKRTFVCSGFMSSYVSQTASSCLK